MVAPNFHHTPEAPHGTAEGSAAGREPSSCASFQPYHQGQLDVFCAVYAVANALRSVHPLGMGQARRLFNDVLLDLSRDADAFRSVLYNATDHDALVRAVLECARRDVVPLRVERPFAASPALRVTGRVGADASAAGRGGRGPDGAAQPTPRAVWETLVGWLCGGTGRAAVLRFHRYLPFKGDPVISHWTAAGIPLGDTLFLHDSSREANAIHVIERGGFVTAPEHLSDDRLVLVEPRCLYLIDVSV
uniref:Peptidase C39-like domain-containing protein n=1 Tax=Nitratidesulfovibrio vulgaris (strain DSM 19637 / Miyazaki F) TaxID=883 RepID=B8DSC5_NITV9